MNKVFISKGKSAAVLRKHPWIFSGAIQSSTNDFSDGDQVEIHIQKGEFVGVGHFQHGTIAVRVLSFENEKIDEIFYKKKIHQAIETRLQLGLITETNSICRLVHGEGDGLPGLIIDYYNGIAVIQCHSIGIFKDIIFIESALNSFSKEVIRGAYLKTKETLPPKMEVEDKFLFGEIPMPHIAIENSISYAIDWVNGQKTGFFIDQRENRALVKKYAKNKVLLNTFCYSGGFSLAAIQGGAKKVYSLDSSKKAITLTDENMALNNYSSFNESIVADTMHYIKELKIDPDIIILDPPAFAKHRDKRHQAVQGYKRLNEAAIRQIKPGGIIFTFSCSQVVNKELFNHTIIAAAIESGREVQILEQLHQPADHPINAFHPEGEYLKGLVLLVK